MHVDQRDFDEGNVPVQAFPVPKPEAVIELIIAMSLCATSLNRAADELAACAASVADPEGQEDLRAAARAQRIRVLEVQGMLAVLSSAFVERHLAAEPS